MTGTRSRGREVFRGELFRQTVSWPRFAVVLFLLLCLWETAARLGWISPLAAPPPSRIGRQLVGLASSGELWSHLVASLRRIFAGWGLGTAAGLAAGTAIGTSRWGRSVGAPLVGALFPVPKIALLPLFILWLGIGEWSKVATIALGVFFPTTVSTYAAIDDVPRALVRMARAFDLPAAAIVRKVLLPGALPGILAGFRISASIALILVVAAEMIGAERGIGALIITSGHLMRTDRLLAGVVVLAALGLLTSSGLTLLERRLLRWR